MDYQVCGNCGYRGPREDFIDTIGQDSCPDCGAVVPNPFDLNIAEVRADGPHHIRIEFNCGCVLVSNPRYKTAGHMRMCANRGHAFADMYYMQSDKSIKKGVRE